jgi:hypothetical protein
VAHLTCLRTAPGLNELIPHEIEGRGDFALSWPAHCTIEIPIEQLKRFVAQTPIAAFPRERTVTAQTDTKPLER